jgi:glycerol-3-phosphate acyltransferase PlsY
MTKKKSIKTTLSGVAASSFSLFGAFCGGGACASACGVACVAPFTSLLGVSTAGLSTWVTNLLPVLTAISAVAFTYSYFALYKQNNNACCDDNGKSNSKTLKNRWSKPIFWIGLLLTVVFYTKAIVNNSSHHTPSSSCETTTSCKTTPSCATDTASKSCNPSSCSPKKNN